MASDHPPECDWNIATLREHLMALIAANDGKYDVRFDAMEKATLAALKSAEQAVLKAENAAEKRFEGVNEFRNTLSDQQRNLIPRAEVDVVVRALHEKINAIEKQMDTMKANAEGIKGGWGYAVGAVGFLLAIGSLAMIGIRFVQQVP